MWTDFRKPRYTVYKVLVTTPTKNTTPSSSLLLARNDKKTSVGGGMSKRHQFSIKGT